jgi:two-component system alkaline phosphatase synthesis response regulator PhoP
MNRKAKRLNEKPSPPAKDRTDPGSPQRRVLLVEDEPGLVMTLTDCLTAEGYRVESAADGETGLERASKEAFDIILLDVMLPRKDGFDVCRDLRRREIDTPILMLTARGQLVDKVLGLRIGADDYLPKPFEPLELLARMEALLRRSSAKMTGSPKDTYSFGNVRVDFRRTEVTRDGKPVELSALELRLLRYFIDHRGETLSRDELLDNVWRYDPSVYSRTVDVHVSSLRQKIERDPANPEIIVTVYGLGYKFLG